MRQYLFLAVLCVLGGSLHAWGGCSPTDVCVDVMDSIVLVKGGEYDGTIMWESDSEPGTLSYYKVVRSKDPGSGSWTEVETVYPDYSCGEGPASYEVGDDPPSGTWTYAVQVYGSGGLVCTVIAPEEEEE